MLRNVSIQDAPQICEIYNYYVEKTIITFEEKPVAIEKMKSKIIEITKSCSLPWYVFEEDGQITGYSYASKWKSRNAYRFTVESTIYLNHKFKGNGIGTTLYKKLFETLRQNKYHSIIAGVALPNENSKRLHEKFGFTQSAHFKEVGYKFDKWIDVGYWQLIL